MTKGSAAIRTSSVFRVFGFRMDCVRGRDIEGGGFMLVCMALLAPPFRKWGGAMEEEDDLETSAAVASYVWHGERFV